MAQPPTIDSLAAELRDKVCEHLATAFAAEYQAKLDSVTQAHDDEVNEYRAKLGLVESKLKASQTTVYRLRSAIYAIHHVQDKVCRCFFITNFVLFHAVFHSLDGEDLT